ncbi:MAG TPA: LPO_1073/Vpar_1526 family protein [Gemmatimonadales bacterium]|nr:LPO_1073/Vpar_1526 family protein [Gemmatimonadales bacterium]
MLSVTSLVVQTGQRLLGTAFDKATEQLVETMWARVVEPALERRLGTLNPVAMSAATQSTVEFLCRLAVRVEDLERQVSTPGALMERAVRSPDASATLQDAAVAAARAESDLARDVLVEAIVERLRAEPESEAAVASKQAVEAVPRLARRHLELLGILTLLYAIRPEGLATPPPVGSAAAESPEMRARLRAYFPWLQGALAAYNLTGRMTEREGAHLDSTGVITFGRLYRRDLSRLLTPLDPNRGYRTPEAIATYNQVQQFLGMRGGDGRALVNLWQNGLERAAPTPAGALIGWAVHRHKCGIQPGVVFGDPWAAAESITEEPRQPSAHELAEAVRAEARQTMRAGGEWP